MQGHLKLLVAVVLVSVIQSSNGKKALVLVDSGETKSTHSMYFQSLKGNIPSKLNC